MLQQKTMPIQSLLLEDESFESKFFVVMTISLSLLVEMLSFGTRKSTMIEFEET